MSQSEHCQCIHCSVKSCAYNENGRYCHLQDVQIAPHVGGCSGQAADECLCASYSCKC